MILNLRRTDDVLLVKCHRGFSSSSSALLQSYCSPKIGWFQHSTAPQLSGLSWIQL